MPKEKWFTEIQLHDIGEFVSYMRGIVHGMSGQYFAKVIGKSPSSISRYEHGQLGISPEKAFDLIMAATTEADEKKINSIIAKIPPLVKEATLNQLIEELNSQGRLHDKGTVIQVAQKLDLPYSYVQRRLSKRRKGLL